VREQRGRHVDAERVAIWRLIKAQFSWTAGQANKPTFRGHRAWTVALESFAAPAPPFEDLAVAEKGKTAVSPANEITRIMVSIIVRSP
jgi:hypothetical protein